jgi:NAD(P)-dependent dehydrogenase (short-subunit alcohol dehydrogenase family)
MKDFKGKGVFITGGASGIGFGLARSFAEKGAKVAIADIRVEAAEEAAAKIRASGAEAIAVQLDVGNPDSWKKAADTAEAAIGPISVLCNNAGTSGAQAVVKVEPLDAMMPAEWELLTRVNFSGPFYGIQTFVPRFKARGGEAHVVNTTSMAGIMPQYAGLPPAYVATKFGAVGLTEQLRLELMDEFPNIGVSMLAPGTVATDVRKSALQVATYGGDVTPDDFEDAYADFMEAAMSPYKVAQAVVKAVENNQFYVFTHPEYKGMSDFFAARIAAGWGESADSTYADPLPEPR